MMSYKKGLKQELGDFVKYVNLTATTVDGKKAKIISSLNEVKIQEDLKYAEYNLLITFEIDANPENIYNLYHNLWRIAETFKILKTQLESPHVYVSNKETILGHFLICYISLTIMRLLELKVFDDKIPMNQLFEFIRQYNIVEGYNDTYNNTYCASTTYKQINEKLSLIKLGNVYLKYSKKILVVYIAYISHIFDDFFIVLTPQIRVES